MNYIHIALTLLTILLGIYSMLKPHSLLRFTGLTSPTGRGVTEVRAVMGALLIGMGAAVLATGGEPGYWILGVTYLSVAAARVLSIFVDKSGNRSNWLSVGFELIMGVLLVL
jgi:hypothetical protein